MSGDYVEDFASEVQTTYTVRAQALVEAVAEYEEAHTPGSPCFAEALAALMRAVCEP